MIEQAAAALMLVCAGKPLPSAKADSGTVGVIRIPVNASMLEKLREEPPVGRLTFVGEAEPKREWIIGGSRDATTGQTTLIRLTKSKDPLNPFAFRGGRAMDQSGLIAFEAFVEGNCFLSSAHTQPKGQDQ
jgi:hypothetical protein